MATISVAFAWAMANPIFKSMFSSLFLFRARFFVLIAVFAALPCCAQSPQPLKPSASIAAQLRAQFEVVRLSFWKAERQLSARAFDSEVDLSRDARMAFFAAPLGKKDSLAADYPKAASAADAYIALAGQSGVAADGLASMLYLGGIAHYTLGNNARALECFERLQKEFPNYQRDQFINDRSTPDPRFAAPARPGVSKLILQLRLQTLPSNPPNSFGVLQQITNEALTALSFQREYSAWVASHSDPHHIRSFEESSFGTEPDQLRASALPRTLDLLESAWDALIEKALQQAGAGALRG